MVWSIVWRMARAIQCDSARHSSGSDIGTVSGRAVSNCAIFSSCCSLLLLAGAADASDLTAGGGGNRALALVNCTIKCERSRLADGVAEGTAGCEMRGMRAVSWGCVLHCEKAVSC